MVILVLRILCIVMAAFATFFNGAVCYVIIRKPRLHKTANWFILSLAVADFCLGSSSLALSFLLDEGLLGKETVMVYFIWFILSASITNLCCMVADRYISFTRPLRYFELLTTKRVVALISTAWLVPLVFIVLNSLPAEVSDNPSRNSEKSWRRTMTYMFVIMASSSTFLLVVTGHTIYIARKLSRESIRLVAQLSFNCPRESKVSITVNNTSKARASAIIIFVVVSNFFLCFSLEAYKDVCSLLPSCAPDMIVSFVSLLLYITNSTLNPLAYSCVKDDIKTELRRLLCCSRTRLHLNSTRSAVVTE